MDREPEELQFLGFVGVCKEAYKIIFSWRKILAQITLSLILPMSFIFLAHIQISESLFKNIFQTEYALEFTSTNTPAHEHLAKLLSSELTAFWLFKVAYIIFILVLSLLSTSAVVYTIACIYTSKDLNFKKVMSVVPKVWKRIMVTFLCIFVIFFAYNLVVVLLVFILFFIFIGPSKVGIPIIVVLSIFYLIGLLYMSVVWQLANIISVLEESYGFQAMVKSKDLIKGKMGVAIAISLKLSILSFVVVQVVFERLVVHGRSIGMGGRISLGFLCLLLFSLLTLLGHVIQTVLYFVCKSYHHESIDKSSLADHLEVYLGQYVPLKGKDVQLEQFDL